MLATKLLRINSKYRTDGSASCTDFSVNIASRDCENISQCVLLSATIPRLFGNVYAPTNVLNCLYSTTPLNPFNSFQPVAFQITPGTYTALTLAAELDRVMNAEFSFVRVRFDEIRQRVTTDPPADFALDILSSGGLAPIVASQEQSLRRLTRMITSTLPRRSKDPLKSMSNRCLSTIARVSTFSKTD